VGFSRAKNVKEARQRVLLAIFGCCCEIIGNLNGFNNRRNGLVGEEMKFLWEEWTFCGGMDFLRRNRRFAGEIGAPKGAVGNVWMLL
jgi:hypothetical protein